MPKQQRIEDFLKIAKVPAPQPLKGGQKKARYVPHGKFDKVYFLQGQQGANDYILEGDLAQHLSNIEHSILEIYPEKKKKLISSKTKLMKIERKRTWNSYGRLKLFILYIFESLGSLEHKPIFKYKSVKSIIKEAQTYAGITSFRAAKYQYYQYKKRKGLRHPIYDGYPQREKKLDRHKNYLIQTLYDWKHLNLIQRAAKLNDIFQCQGCDAYDAECETCQNSIQVSASTLRIWYKAQNINYIKAEYKIANSMSSEEMLKQQQDFIVKLMKFWQDDREIIFLDESTVSPWMTNFRSWMLSDKPFNLRISPDKQNERASISVIAAISSVHNRLIYHIEKGSDVEPYKVFLNKLCASFTQPSNTVIVLDQAQIHKGNPELEIFLKKSVGVLFIPAASPNLNPCEKFWSILKRRILLQLSQYEYPQLKKLNTRYETQRAIQNILDEGKIDFQKLTRAIFPQILRVTRGLIV